MSHFRLIEWISPQPQPNQNLLFFPSSWKFKQGPIEALFPLIVLAINQSFVACFRLQSIDYDETPYRVMCFRASEWVVVGGWSQINANRIQPSKMSLHSNNKKKEKYIFSLLTFILSVLLLLFFFSQFSTIYSLACSFHPTEYVWVWQWAGSAVDAPAPRALFTQPLASSPIFHHINTIDHLPSPQSGWEVGGFVWGS